MSTYPSLAGNPAWKGYTTDLWQSGQAPTQTVMGGEGAQFTQQDPANWGSFNPQDLKSMGFMPGASDAERLQGATSSHQEGGGADAYPVYDGWSPALQQYMGDNGYTSLQGRGEGDERQQFLHNGELYGLGQNTGHSSDDAFGIATLLAGGGIGAEVAGAGAGLGAGTGEAVGGGTGGATAGASSSDLAALYGDAGYGSTAATGATNPALIESAMGTPGYGMSSAGAGGGAGQGFSLGSTLQDLYQGYQKYNQVKSIGNMLGGQQHGSSASGGFGGGGGAGLSAGDRYRQRMAAQSLRDMSQYQAPQKMPGWIPGG